MAHADMPEADTSGSEEPRPGTVAPPELPRVGFIGLGYMGRGMAVNIQRHGFPLAVMAHHARAAVEDLVAHGALEVATPSALAACSDIVVLCVPGAAEVASVVRGREGLAAGARRKLIIIDCTTSDPSTLLSLATEFAGRNIAFADAPLGRSPREAWQGTLSTMVGCEATVFAQIRPLLASFATTIRHIGGLGDGHRLKLVNNLISLGYAALYSDALVLALKAGLSTDAYDQLVRSSRMHCAFYDTFIGWVLDGDAESHQFSLDMALHTISEVAAFSRTLGLRGGLVESVRALYREAVAEGRGRAMLPELPRSVGAANGLALTPARRDGAGCTELRPHPSDRQRRAGRPRPIRPA